MAPRTDRRFTRDLMLEAVPNSSANILATRGIWSFGGMMSEIILVPLLQQTGRKYFNKDKLNISFCYLPSCCFKAFYQFFDLPNLNISICRLVVKCGLIKAVRSGCRCHCWFRWSAKLSLFRLLFFAKGPNKNYWRTPKNQESDQPGNVLLSFLLLELVDFRLFQLPST